MASLNRRNFIFGLGGLAAAVIAEKAIPFGRVWSFPKQIKIATPKQISYLANPRADLTIQEIEDSLNYLWSNYHATPDFVVVSSDVAESMGFKSMMGIEGPYFDPHYVGSFARSNV